MSACRNSPDGKHKWQDIVFVVGHEGSNTAGFSEKGWPGLQCSCCGATSWRTYWGEVYDDVLEKEHKSR